MTKSIKYTWPVLAYILINGIGLLMYVGGLPYPDSFNTISTLLISVCGIYYLYTSPFSETNFLPLTSLIIIRYFIPIMVPFTITTGISFYMGSNMAILFLYALRTLNKEPIRKIDYTKLFLLGGFIFLQIAHYGGLLYIEYTPKKNLSFPLGTYLSWISYMNAIARFIVFILALVHLWHVGKWEKDNLDQEELDLIDRIGEEDE